MKKMVALVVVIVFALGVVAAFAAEAKVGDKVKDVVSAKEVVVKADTPKSEFPAGSGTWFYFESAANKATFDKEPAKYLPKK